MSGLRTKWERGEKVALAARADISPQYLSDLLCGRKRALPELGKVIEEKAREMGLYLSKIDLMFPHESSNPLMNTNR